MTSYRVGCSSGRTIYLIRPDHTTDLVIGMMDAPELARVVVDALNAAEQAKAREKDLTAASKEMIAILTRANGQWMTPLSVFCNLRKNDMTLAGVKDDLNVLAASGLIESQLVLSVGTRKYRFNTRPKPEPEPEW